MRLAVTSGKGGAGKTTVSVGMALSLAPRGGTALVDCDAEEPNCHCFLDISDPAVEPVTAAVPVVDEDACTACGVCGEVCQFNALAALKTKPILFPELCHGCGACVTACPVDAMSETERKVGELRRAETGGLTFIEGRITVGEVMSTPVIRAARRAADGMETVILDSPPGTACPMVAAVKDADFALLVADPTPFGLNDAILAADTVRRMGVPFGMIVNRADPDDRRVHEYCEREGVRIYLEIPDDRRIAEAYSRGRPVIEAVPELGDMFRGAVDEISATVAEPAGGSAS